LGTCVYCLISGRKIVSSTCRYNKNGADHGRSHYLSLEWKEIHGSSFMELRVVLGQAPVAHACNPGYSGGRDQENHGSKPTWTDSSRDLILKKPITKKELVE
jgi:hypothetical protein